MLKDTLKIFTKAMLVLGFLYLFLVSIGLLGEAFKGFGKEFAENLLRMTSNPFVSLFIGILATSLMQSSSTTTSIVVGMVASGTITVGNAIPIIMGANIGTTVTNTLVSIGHITRREEFKRAIAGATVHDFFNLFVWGYCFHWRLQQGFYSGWLQYSQPHLLTAEE
ncbi:MAG: Na/Pi symporter [Candidatus Omnitrophica bacterium]|nr:Na/Pi symporter [Candidatus Omnitrophota bacterium]